MTNLWGAMWRSDSKLSGKRRHLIYNHGFPALFHTRSAARKFINEQYGYIRTRADLRAEPHGWRLPLPVKVTLHYFKDGTK